MIRALTLVGCLMIAGFTQADRYAVGQVWEYRTRPQDEGSLVKIQRIEPYGDGQVYHLTIVGVSIGSERMPIHHTPVTREALDASVTKRGDPAADFPAADEGIAQWRAAEGGVFTISVAEIAQLLDDAMTDGG